MNQRRKILRRKRIAEKSLNRIADLNKVLRVKIHQNTVSYRNPITAEVIETYPLPPPSTILGLLCSIIKEQNLTPGSINLSIQGTYRSLLRDYQWYKKYQSNRPYPILVHTLCDVNLVIHLYFANEKLANRVMECMVNPPYYPYLGRAEDLIKIEETAWVDPIIESRDSGIVKCNSYIRRDQAERLRLGGIPYRLPSYPLFSAVSARGTTKLLREFYWTDLMYVQANAIIESKEETPIFSDGVYDIWWCMQNPIPKKNQKH